MKKGRLPPHPIVEFYDAVILAGEPSKPRGGRRAVKSKKARRR